MGYQIKERVLIDGVKLIFTTGDWLLIRPSGTEPVFRIYIETNSAEAMERLTEFATKFVK
jgi:phosphomannomutase